MQANAMIWETVEWRQGDGRYRFSVHKGGLHATLAAPSGQELTIPMVAWDGLLDALAAARKARSRAERAIQPRHRAQWTAIETNALVNAFQAGGSIAALARQHGRSGWAIESRLAQLGLWDRDLRQRLSGPPERSNEALPPADQAFTEAQVPVAPNLEFAPR
ncbi:MAG: hypothetical protein ACKVP7_28145 [Hyphomicrobiaceae bacterium]